ncbi:transmembrane protein 44 isoform X2 [Cavia porcellus]|uniref:transmembrane protein 44 isoform X2 n=1 Tax=Cavia porcellus TaxID=10141 RepID=UPI002FE24257
MAHLGRRWVLNKGGDPVPHPWRLPGRCSRAEPLCRRLRSPPLEGSLSRGPGRGRGGAGTGSRPDRGAMGEAAAGDPSYLGRCFVRRRVCASFALWLCAACCWVAAHALLLYLRCAAKPRQDPAALCAACRLLSSLCDVAGAALARQLPIQVFTGAYLAAVDLLGFLSIVFRPCTSPHRLDVGPGTRARTRRRRWQRLRTPVFVLALLLGLVPGWALWAAVPKMWVPVPGSQRRLLGNLPPETTDVLGYLLGGIAVLGAWASQIPPLCRIGQGKPFSCIHLWSRFLDALAGLLYASAIVAHDQRPKYLLRAMPWFLTSLGHAALDLALIPVSCVVRTRARRAVEPSGSPDSQVLLPRTSGADGSPETGPRDQGSDWVQLSTLWNCKSLRTVAAISPTELTLGLVQQVACGTVKLPNDGQTDGCMRVGDTTLQKLPSSPPMQCPRAWTSSTSLSEALSVTSDLEDRDL